MDEGVCDCGECPPYYIIYIFYYIKRIASRPPSVPFFPVSLIAKTTRNQKIQKRSRRGWDNCPFLPISPGTFWVKGGTIVSVGGTFFVKAGQCRDISLPSGFFWNINKKIHTYIHKTSHPFEQISLASSALLLLGKAQTLDTRLCLPRLTRGLPCVHTFRLF